jgi:uncharacterized protein YbbC (DUF1343 family)
MPNERELTPAETKALEAEVDDTAHWVNPDDRAVYLGAISMAVRYGLTIGQAQACFRNAYAAAANNAANDLEGTK